MGQAGSGDALGKVSLAERPGSVNEVFLQAGRFLPRFVYPFHAGEALPPFVGEEHLLFQCSGDAGDALVGPKGADDGGIRDEDLARCRADFQGGFGVGERFRHQELEAVENGKNNEERRRADGHAGHPDARNQINHIVGLAGKKVAEGES